MRLRARAKQYGLSNDEIEAALSLTVCEICGAEFDDRGPQLDHNHETNRFRGVLCFGCNVGIGHMKESVEVLLRAIQYLGAR
jgi:hypothetical protein